MSLNDPYITYSSLSRGPHSMNNIGSNVNHILKKKNPTSFLSIKLNTVFVIKRCPESGPWPAHLVNQPFYGWRSHIQPHPSDFYLLIMEVVDQWKTNTAEMPTYNQPGGWHTFDTWDNPKGRRGLEASIQGQRANY